MVNFSKMGMGSFADAAEWDFVEYSKALGVWNEIHKPEAGEGEEAESHSEPPSIEWMMADDQRAMERGHRVH